MSDLQPLLQAAATGDTATIQAWLTVQPPAASWHKVVMESIRQNQPGVLAALLPSANGTYLHSSALIEAAAHADGQVLTLILPALTELSVAKALSGAIEKAQAMGCTANAARLEALEVAVFPSTSPTQLDALVMPSSVLQQRAQDRKDREEMDRLEAVYDALIAGNADTVRSLSQPGDVPSMIHWLVREYYRAALEEGETRRALEVAAPYLSADDVDLLRLGAQKVMGENAPEKLDFFNGVLAGLTRTALERSLGDKVAPPAPNSPRM